MRPINAMLSTWFLISAILIASVVAVFDKKPEYLYRNIATTTMQLIAIFWVVISLFHASSKLRKRICSTYLVFTIISLCLVAAAWALWYKRFYDLSDFFFRASEILLILPTVVYYDAERTNRRRRQFSPEDSEEGTARRHPALHGHYSASNIAQPPAAALSRRTLDSRPHSHFSQDWTEISLENLSSRNPSRVQHDGPSSATSLPRNSSYHDLGPAGGPFATRQL